MEPISGSLSLLLPLISQIAGKGSYGANQGGMSLLLPLISQIAGKGGMSPDTALNPLFGGLQLPGVAMQGILGIKQLFDARKLEKSTRKPTYTIPGAQQESLALARANAYGPSPGLNVAQAAMGRGLAGGMSSALQSGGPEGLAAAAMMAQGNSDQSMNLAAQQEQWRAQQMGNVLSALNRQAEYQDVGWRKNYEEPFLQASEKAAQLRDAGYTNTQDFLYGAGGTIASMAKNGWIGGKGNAGSTGAGTTPAAGQSGTAQPTTTATSESQYPTVPRIGSDGFVITNTMNARTPPSLINAADTPYLGKRDGMPKDLPYSSPVVNLLLKQGLLKKGGMF